MSTEAVGSKPLSATSDLTQTAPAGSAATNRQLLFWMFSFLRPVKVQVVIACSCLALWVAVEVLAVRQTGEAVNHIKQLQISTITLEQGFWAWLISPQADARGLRNLILTIAGLAVALAMLRYLREMTNTRLSMQMVYYLREAIYDKLQRVGFAFHDALSTGQLINRALSDLQHVRSFIQMAVLTSLEIALIVGGYIALILTREPWMALLALVPLPFWTFYILRFGKKVQPASKAVMEAQDRNVSVITENIAGVHVVKAFAIEKQEIDKYGANSDLFFARVLKRIRLFANFTPVIRGIAVASHLSLFWVAGIMIIWGRLEIGDFLILGAAMGAILTRLQQVATINEQYQNAIVSAHRLHEVLMARPTVPEKPGARPLPPGRGAVVFENVTFGYTPDKPVLHGISFRVPGGSVVAIIGPTGAGKTTLVNLLARFYDPHPGRVLVDGVDVREVQLASLRTQVALVFQETYLFSDTVSANISYGRPGITPGEIEAAARLAQAQEFIETLPQGYDTILGERGSSLSGGQRQRLAIARAIVTNPRIIVLDDATASVDPETEEMIHRGIELCLQGRTTFIIAHRISTVKRADLVIVLEDGGITQMGTHDELMATDGHYREIAAVQLHGDGGADEEIQSHMDRMVRQRSGAGTPPPEEPRVEPSAAPGEGAAMEEAER